jgi:hypothetical protein
MLICLGCLDRHSRPAPADRESCGIIDCECWCRSNDVVLGPVLDKPACDKLAAELTEFFGGPSIITGRRVADELAKPEMQRDVIGLMAATILEENRVTDWTVDYPGEPDEPEPDEPETAHAQEGRQ